MIFFLTNLNEIQLSNITLQVMLFIILVMKMINIYNYG